MKRSLLALAALAGMSLGIVRADYIIIKVNMDVAPAQAAPVQPVPGVGQPMPQPMPKPAGPKKVPSGKLTIIAPFEYAKMQPIDTRAFNPPLPQGASVGMFTHKWGVSYLYTDDEFIQIAPSKIEQGITWVVPIKRPTVLQQFEKRKGENPKDKSGTKKLDLAMHALENGLLKQCVEVMDELSKSDLSKEPAKVTDAVKAFDKVRKDLARPVSRDEPAILWKNELRYQSTPSEEGHYVLLHDTTGIGEVKNRLARMERNMEAFYYWFALRGKALPVPDRRMVGIVIEKQTEFSATYKACGSPTFVADGFFGRRDNLVVFSASRLDPVCEPLARHFTELIQAGWPLKDMMNPKWKPPAGKQITPQEFYQIHTMALVKRILEEESEIATVSHQCSRQLLAAIGMLPRSVEIPEWVQFGWPAFFETPKFDPTTHTVAFWPGTGAPSWTYLVQWKLWEIDKQLEEPLDGLMGVLTDRFFREAQRTRDPEKLLKARTYAWALAYFLANKDLDGLLRYGEELSQLPRDLEFDGEVHLGCFARAFKRDDPTKPNGADLTKLEALARDWYKFIGIEPLQMPELLPEAQKVYKARQAATVPKPAGG
jgi:hypothetical protein